MKEKSIFGFDFEVFKFDWLVVFINKYTQKKYIISNDVNELKSFYSEHKDDIFVGYNSRNYDQFIFKGILDGKNPFDISEQLIIYRKSGYQVIRNNRKYPLNNYDVGDIQHSLKQYEAFMGSTIKESSVDFNINRKLTSDEIVFVNIKLQQI